MKHRAQGSRVVLLGLDAAELTLVRRWAAAGHLPHCAALLREGQVSELVPRAPHYREAIWTTFHTGCRPETTGHYSALRYAPDYSLGIDRYDYRRFPHFYSLCGGKRVLLLDVPKAHLYPSVPGVQVLAWGAHSPRHPPASLPPALRDELARNYGRFAALENDNLVVPETASKGPWLAREIVAGARRRARAFVDLLRREPWDLAMTVLSEPHAAGHAFWHLSQPDHPAFPLYRGTFGADPLLAAYAAADEALGLILAHVPRDARLVVFALEGMKANSSELPANALLPEVLYRASFPGRVALTASGTDTALPPLEREDAPDWTRLVWGRIEDRAPVRRWLRRRAKLRLSHLYERAFGAGHELLHPRVCAPFESVPAAWYRAAWPRMIAFALPSFGDGMVRLNLRGREAAGIVPPEDYDRVCGDITRLLLELRDGRRGEPVVQSVARSRAMLPATAPLPDADLAVRWCERPVDVLDHPVLGRIGPLPFLRSGDHTERGFLIHRGPGVPAGPAPPGDIVDLAPTVLSLLGTPLPRHFDGRPLVAAADAGVP